MRAVELRWQRISPAVAQRRMAMAWALRFERLSIARFPRRLRWQKLRIGSKEHDDVCGEMFNVHGEAVQTGRGHAGICGLGVGAAYHQQAKRVDALGV